ncbi:hypothetical protein VTO73DRAFT_11811 [Trametes versicolor]
MYASVRKFARTTCRRHITLELPQETLARARRAQAAQKSTKGICKAPRRDAGPRIVKYRTWKTYKYHALGHHPSYVERSGTTDNHNTLVGELEHRHAKRVYARTNKYHFEKQIGIHQRRQALLRGIRAGLEVRAREHPGLADKHPPLEPHRAARGRLRPQTNLDLRTWVCAMIWGNLNVTPWTCMNG